MPFRLTSGKHPEGLSHRNYCVSFGLWQGFEHVGDTETKNGMNPIWRDIGQRDENEGALLQARVGQDKALRRLRPLPFRRQPTPLGMSLTIRQNAGPPGDEIKIQRPRPPPLATHAPELALY